MDQPLARLILATHSNVSIIIGNAISASQYDVAIKPVTGLTWMTESVAKINKGISSSDGSPKTDPRAGHEFY